MSEFFEEEKNRPEEPPRQPQEKDPAGEDEHTETVNTVYTPMGGSPFTYPNPAPAEHPKPKPPRAGVAMTAALLALCLILGMVGGAAGMMIALVRHGDGSIVLPEAGETTGGETEKEDPVTIYRGGTTVNVVTVPDDGVELTVAELYAKVADSVVSISTSTQMTSSFHGGFYVTTGSGSGVILSDDGYVVTNYHVVKDATEITVTLSNELSYPAVFLDGDVAKDVALLKIEPEAALLPVQIGVSASLVVGQDVVAIGNPLGYLPGTVTSGIVSALDRTLSIEGYSRTLIQTTAAISPGNSGGALFDRYGNLVGIISAKNSAEGVEGLGFAIPIDSVFEEIVEIIQDGYIHDRACFDLDLEAITNANDAFYLYRNQTAGIYVQASRYEGGIDLRTGDRIHSVNGVEIRSESELNTLLSTLHPGEEVELEVGRIKVVSSGYWSSYKEELVQVRVPLIEFIPSPSVSFD